MSAYRVSAIICASAKATLRPVGFRPIAIVRGTSDQACSQQPLYSHFGQIALQARATGSRCVIFLHSLIYSANWFARCTTARYSSRIPRRNSAFSANSKSARISVNSRRTRSASYGYKGSSKTKSPSVEQHQRHLPGSDSSGRSASTSQLAPLTRLHSFFIRDLLEHVLVQ